MNRSMMFDSEASSRRSETSAHNEFVPFDVLLSERERIQRLAAILRASTLESIAPNEVTIVAESAVGTLRIRTRISAVSEDNVFTVDAGAIPVHCIRTIESA